MELKFISKLHNSTKRNYIQRMVNDKVNCMKIAKKYSKEYWDGSRKYGYGGYKYIPGRWKRMAHNLIKFYKLKKGSKILDIGCGKAFLLKEIKLLNPEINIFGTDISRYALKKIEFPKKNFFNYSAQSKLHFPKNYFDLVISINTLHNLEIFDLEKSLKEIERVGKKKYIVVESYRNNQELFNLQCWALTCNSFLNVKEWKYILKKFKYSGDYEFIFFK